MITEFGKFCRKLRVDRGEVAKHMADELGVTTSFLSAVENGKRTIPKRWVEEISESYGLSTKKSRELFILVSLSNLSINEKQALNEAMSAIQLKDSSDYMNGLWGVIAALLGEKAVDDDGFDLKEWLDFIKEDIEKGNTK